MNGFHQKGRLDKEIYKLYGNVIKNILRIRNRNLTVRRKKVCSNVLLDFAAKKEAKLQTADICNGGIR